MKKVAGGKSPKEKLVNSLQKQLVRRKQLVGLHHLEVPLISNEKRSRWGTIHENLKLAASHWNALQQDTLGCQSPLDQQKMEFQRLLLEIKTRLHDFS